MSRYVPLRWISLASALVLGVLLFEEAAVAQDANVVFVVLRAADGTSVPSPVLRRMLRGYQSSWPSGARTRVVLPGQESQSYEIIARSVFETSGRGMTRHWLQAVFSGRALAPTFVSSDEEVIAQVQALESAVGVIASPPSVLPEGLMVVQLD